MKWNVMSRMQTQSFKIAIEIVFAVVIRFALV